jgi:hypothetical protein
MEPSEEKTPQPVLIMGAVLATLGSLTTATAFIDAVPMWVAGLLAAVTTALTVGLTFYTKGQVTPSLLVGARRLENTNSYIAGPAAPKHVKPGKTVELVAPTTPLQNR